MTAQAWLSDACVELLGQPLRRVVWSSGRLAAVWQVELSDGAQVVLKARPAANRLHARLAAAAELQSVGRKRGLPLPEVVVAPTSYEGLVVSAEAPLDAPRYEPAKQVLTTVSAGELARLVAALADVQVPDVLRSPQPWCDSDRSRRQGVLWPKPHDEGLFGASFAGQPAAVRGLAEEAAALLEAAWQAPHRVLAHDDWEAQNLRFAPTPDRVVAVYDGDSLAALPEPVAVGTAAAVHLAGCSHGPAAPPEDVDAFIDEYARLRPVNHASARAAAAWVVAYNGACDHVLDQTGAGTFLDACGRYGRQYLA